MKLIGFRNVIFSVIMILFEYFVRGLTDKHTEVLHDNLKKMLKMKAHEVNRLTGLDSMRRKDYPLETHNITTKSGYILTVHRIPSGIHSTGPVNRRPIYLQHGIMQSSIHWLISPGNNSLAYLLVDNGFDVWLGNNRGNPFSIGHISMSSENFSYWDFSFHEMGTEDIPTVIDYILEKTNRTKISYIGYSMGTTAFIVAMTMRPEYNAKIHIFIALAPVVFVDHGKNPLSVLINNVPAVPNVLEFLRITFKLKSAPEDSDRDIAERIFPNYCRHDMISASLCSLLIFALVGWNPGQMDQHLTPIILHGVAPTAFKNFVHYSQIAATKRFQLFDYGKRNVDFYGKVSPPVYPLKKHIVPTALIWSQNDFLGSVPDVARLASLLPNVVDNYRIRLDEFNHYDFAYGLDSYDLVYQHLMALLSKYDVDVVDEDSQ